MKLRNAKKSKWNQEKFIFFLCMYKMVDISVETWNKAEVSVINTFKMNLYLWHCKNIYDPIDKEIKGKYKATSMSDLTKQQIKMSKIDRSRLIKGSKNSMYVHEDIAITIMQSRLADPEILIWY